MKKIIISSIAILVVSITTANANYTGPEPDQQVLDAFKKQFTTAQNVSWDKEEGFDKATFGIAGRKVIAYFNQHGNLEGCVRDLAFDQLPLAVSTSLNTKYDDLSIMEIREISNATGTSYQLTINARNKKMKICVAPDGNVFESTKLK